MQRRGAGFNASGRIRLGDGAFPLLNAPEEAGKQAALIGACRINGDHYLQRGDRRPGLAFPHERRHQQAARIAPAVGGLPQRRLQHWHLAQGIGRSVDLLDHFAQPGRGVGPGETIRSCRINHGATPSTKPSPRER
ncbi:hypothetical protein D9M68_673680 [compost metagenome]